MIWIIEYLNGNVVTEEQFNFQYVDKEKVKYFYFFDKKYNDIYGIDVVNKIFFINDKQYDFKLLDHSFKIIEYKTANYNLHTNVHKISSWNIGLEFNSNNIVENYVMSISSNKEVNFNALKRDLHSGKVEEKEIRLQ